MKRNKRISMILAGCLAVFSVQAASIVEKPVVLPEAMVSVTVPDVHGFIDEIGIVASQAQPMMNGAFIKSMIGMQLGDPGLTGIAPGKGLSIVALDMTNVFAVVELSEAQSTNYLNMVKANGLQAEYKEGALLMAWTPEALEKGSALAGSVRSILLEKPSSTLRAALQPAAVIERNRAAIDQFLQMLPILMGQGIMQQPGATLESAQIMTQVLEGELRLLLSLAAQCETAELVLAPKDGSIRLTETFKPKAGTRLATLVNAPAVSDEHPNVHAGALGDATMHVDFHFANPEALGAFVAAEAENLISEMQLTDADIAKLGSTMKKWIGIYSGTGCEAVKLGADGKLKADCVIGIGDEARAMEVLRTMSEDAAPLLKLYDAIGMPMTMEFKENVAQTNGAAIHQLTIKTDLTSMPEDQKQQMKNMGLESMTYDLAIADGLLFYSEPGGIPALIEKIKAGGDAGKIEARNVYPAGGFYYFDLHADEYMAFVASTLPNDPSLAMMKQQMGSLFAGVEPITSAGFKEDGIFMWSVSIPGDLIAKIGQLAMMMQMQQMQRQMGAPQGMPSATPQAAPAPEPVPEPAPAP